MSESRRSRAREPAASRRSPLRYRLAALLSKYAFSLALGLTIRDPMRPDSFLCYDVERRRAKRILLSADRHFDRWVYYPMTFVNDIFALTAKAAAPAKIKVVA
jgi:hypothetical protein